MARVGRCWFQKPDILEISSQGITVKIKLDKTVCIWNEQIWMLTWTWDTIETHSGKFYVRDTIWGTQSFSQYFLPNSLFSGVQFVQTSELSSIPVAERTLDILAL